MGKSSKKAASEAGDAPTKPSNKGKRKAEDIIRIDNRKKRKKRKKHKKKALVEENDGGAKTRKTFIKEKNDDYMDEQELKPSGALIPAESNSKASKEDRSGKEESSEEQPSKMQEVEESVTVPVENNSSEEISSEEDMAASSDEEETGMDATPKEQTSGSKTLYVGNLSLSAEKADVEKFFKAAGEIVDVRLSMGSDISFRCFGHVEFSTTEGAIKALEQLNGKVLVGRPVRLHLAKEKEVQSFQKGGRTPRQTVFVCGFNKDDGEDQIRSALQDHFGSCGEITRVSIPKDIEGGVRGIAYIDFKDYDAYNHALEFNGSVFHKNTLTVEAANPRDNGFDSGSRGDWRGGRGSGGRFSGHQRGGLTGRGHFSGGGQGGRGHGHAAPGGI